MLNHTSVQYEKTTIVDKACSTWEGTFFGGKSDNKNNPFFDRNQEHDACPGFFSLPLSVWLLQDWLLALAEEGRGREERVSLITVRHERNRLQIVRLSLSVPVSPCPELVAVSSSSSSLPFHFDSFLFLIPVVNSFPPCNCSWTNLNSCHPDPPLLYNVSQIEQNNCAFSPQPS